MIRVIHVVNVVFEVPMKISRKFYINPENMNPYVEWSQMVIRNVKNPNYDLRKFIFLTNLNPDSDGLQSSISIRSTVSAIPLSRSPRTALI